MLDKNKDPNQSRRRRSTGNKGFSMIEMMAVIGIIAMLLVVLVPSLLSYSERSRAGKDFTATDELVNAVLLAMADQRVYDDVVSRSVLNNVSCYIDTPNESAYTKVVTKPGTGTMRDQYMFTSEARLADEVPYFAAGNMRGVTVTFEPYRDASSNSTYYLITHGVINKFMNQGESMILDEDCAYLCNNIRQTVGERILIDSQTYRNSEFTVFIRIGSLGGNQGSSQDAVTVYGQFSGTNLSENDILYYPTTDRDVPTDAPGGTSNGGPAHGNSEPSVDPGLLNGGGVIITPDDGIPAGGHYYVGVSSRIIGDYATATAVYTIGDELPRLSTGDIFVYGDYEYRYNYDYNGASWERNESMSGWGVAALSKVKLTYRAVITLINGAPLTSMRSTYYQCYDMIKAPTIPSTVKNLRSTFNFCTSLTKPPIVPDGVTNMAATFRHCTSLQEGPDIPVGVTYLNYTFENCKSLNGTMNIDANIAGNNRHDDCFLGAGGLVYLTGSSTMLKELAATDRYEDLSENDHVRVAAENPTELSNVVPEGGTYYVGVGYTKQGNYSTAKQVITSGYPFPAQASPGDVYVYGDYEYRYLYHWQSEDNSWHRSSDGGWRVRVRSTTKAEYGPLLASINGEHVTDLTRTFMNCTNMVVSPAIPGSITRLDSTFYGCTKMETVPEIADNVTYMYRTFFNCKALTGVIVIDATPSSYSNCFKGTSKSIYLTGGSGNLAQLAATDGYTNQSANDNVRVLTQDSALYVVNHWQLNVTGTASSKDNKNYTIHETQKLTGIVGTSVTPSVRSYTGFASPSATTVTIADDGSTVVNYYYTRNLYYIDLNLEWDGTFYTSIGADTTPCLFTLTINDKVVSKNIADYWIQWPYGTKYKIEIHPKGGYYWGGVMRSGSSALEGTVGTSGVSVAPVILTNKETTYVVKHWLQDLDGVAGQYNDNNYTLKESATLTALIGYEASPFTNNYTGFITPSRQGAIVKEDGSTVINYYYDRKTVGFDINTRLDGVDNNYSTDGIRFTVTVNGEVIARNVGDFCQPVLYGSSYSIEIHLSNKYNPWTGALANGSSPISGVATSGVAVRPIFTSK